MHTPAQKTQYMAPTGRGPMRHRLSIDVMHIARMACAYNSLGEIDTITELLALDSQA